MAISINDQYPGKTAGVSDDYPQGQARNITTPGDGTGTPWEAAIVNDDQGFKQAILAEAGVTPSGVPDTALESQYLDALKSMFMPQDAITGTVGASGTVTIPVSGTNALIAKWGNVDYPSNPGEIGVNVNFPTAFPTACAVVMVTRKASAHGTDADGGALLFQQSKTGFGVTLQIFNSDAVSKLRGFSWVAIGW